MRIYLSRFLTTEKQENLERMLIEAKEAHEKKCSLVVFPELFLTGYKGEIKPKNARQYFKEASKKYSNQIFVFGTISEEKSNRSLVYFDGEEVLRYDKVHLFKPNNEHKIWEKGKEYKATKVNSLNLGVIVCNDIRFPESARTLKIGDKIDLLVVPAFWPLRRNEIWKNLLRTRAIENAVYVAGCCISHLETKNERFFGALNYVFDPLGNPVETKDDRVYEIQIPFKKKILVDPLKD
ncbi:MAG: carbon-nitrogen hydrolase family protein [Acidobacteria bacterium]|nr:carbon-nitrogen hydrolase family protein [Acidobacteriota bacterium]